MGRAIVRDPQVFLFDEPLSNLDAKLRVTMRVEIKELHQRLKTTTIYVTHDQIEAMTMASKIVVMRDGRVEQIGKPLDLYDFPANIFVAGFIGSPSMNLLQGRIGSRDGRRAVITEQGVALPVENVNLEDGRPVIYGIRPEHITIGGDDGIPVEVSVFEPTGSETLIFGRAGGVPIDALIRERIDGAPGKTMRFHIDPRRVHIFDQETGQRL
jgi:multiple sugar transport system ATP-binding protein